MYIVEKEKTYKFSMLDLETKKMTYFEELEDLLSFLATGQNVFRYFFNEDKNVYNNIYLDDMNLTGYDRRIQKKYNFQTKEIEYYSTLKRYMFYDAQNNVLDVTIHASNIRKRAKKHYEEHRWNNKPDYIYRRGPVPGTNIHHRGHYCRRLKTTREKKFACDPEHKPYIRAKRNFKNIPDTYDERIVNLRRDWKSKTKQRKQWARHLEYSKVPDKYSISNFFDYDEDLLDDE